MNPHADEDNAVLSLLPVGPEQRRLAVGVVLVSVVLFVLVAPFAKVPLAQVPAFLPFYQSAVIINDAITALLLVGQARVARSRAMLVLACGYVFTALITLVHLLTYPAVFAPTGLLGAGPQSTAWLYMFWHSGFPLVVIAYALLGRGEPRADAIGGRTILLGIGWAALATVGLSALAIAGHDLLPELLSRNRYIAGYGYVSTTVSLLPMIAIAVLWGRRPHTVLDVWLLVVMCAWVLEIALGAVLNGGRYDLGFYAGRIYGLLAASFVLMVLLFEHSILYAGLLEARASERRKNSELIAATAEMATRREQESSRKLLDAVVRQMPGGLVIADATGRPVFANDKANAILGFPVTERRTREELDALLHADGRPLAKEDYPLVRALEGESISEQEILLRQGDGRQRVLAASAAPVHDVDGRLMGAVAAFTDITARKEAEKERHELLDREQQARTEAEIANRSKDEFLAMLGHELRNPLAPIRTALQLMRLRGDSALMTERVIIERQVEHLVRLVDDLLDVSRITSGKVELRRDLCDVADIVTRAVEMASPIIEQRRHRLNVAVPRGLVIHCDRVRFSQVVSNLLINAAKYTQPQGEISVGAAREAGEVMLSVKDNGPGLTRELLTRMFEPFVQGSQNLERSQGGLGLGLAIARSIVNLHQGSISAYSAGLGTGSEFIVRVPAIAQAAPVGADVGSIARTASGIREVRVMVVDDNVDAARMLALALEADGLRADLAHDGPEALVMARERPYQVVLLDLGLPVMDGYELGARLRAIPETAEATLVAITGYGESADRERTRREGFAAHLVKPVNIEEVMQVIREAVSRLPGRGYAAE